MDLQKAFSDNINYSKEVGLVIKKQCNDYINICKNIENFNETNFALLSMSNLIDIRRELQKSIGTLDMAASTLHKILKDNQQRFNQILSVTNKEIYDEKPSKKNTWEINGEELVSPILKTPQRSKKGVIKPTPYPHIEKTDKLERKIENKKIENRKREEKYKPNVWKTFISSESKPRFPISNESNSRFGQVNDYNPDRFSTKKDISNGFITVERYKRKVIGVNMGFDIYINMPLYKNRESIPELNYGVIKYGIKELILFRLSKNKYVSCETGIIAPEDNNIRTILCNNQPCCNYGNKCRYYHSPLYYPDSDHIKMFFKTPLCPKAPDFGDGRLFHIQKQQRVFTEVNTLASYCASQLLLIRLLCQHHDE